jgi:hypothetical protein
MGMVSVRREMIGMGRGGGGNGWCGQGGSVGKGGRRE